MGTIYRDGEMYGSNTSIDDTKTSDKSTWSSEKISEEIGNKKFKITQIYHGNTSEVDVYQAKTLLDSLSKYDMLIFQYKYYASILQSVLMTRDQFKYLDTNNSRVQMYFGTTAVAQVYYESDTSINLWMHEPNNHYVTILGISI